MAKGDIVEQLLFSIPFNLTGLPALTMSGGFDKRGAPIGFQLVGSICRKICCFGLGIVSVNYRLAHPPSGAELILGIAPGLRERAGRCYWTVRATVLPTVSWTPACRSVAHTFEWRRLSGRFGSTSAARRIANE